MLSEHISSCRMLTLTLVHVDVECSVQIDISTCRVYTLTFLHEECTHWHLYV